MQDLEEIKQHIKECQKVLDKATAKLEELEVTYSIGDRFKHKDGDEYLLAVQATPRVEVSLVCLKDGCLWNGSYKVESVTRISPNEIVALRNNTIFIRIFDRRKQAKV